MEKILLIALILTSIISIVELFVILKRKSENEKPRDIITELVKVKDKIDSGIDRDRDSLLINNYLDVVKDILNNFDNSRSKQVAYRTRRVLMYNLLLVLPAFDRCTDIRFEYDTTSKIPQKHSDRDIMRLLRESYNSYSEENQDVLNDFISCTLWLYENK